MKRTSRSFGIALSAISCAFATLSLTLGSYVHALFPVGVLIAVFALMVPLAEGYWFGASLSFVGALILSFLFCAFNFLLLIPFAVFFGLHPFANEAQMRFVRKKWLHGLCFLLKAAWFCLAIWLSWAVVFVPVLGVDQMVWYPYVEPYFYYVLFLGGTLLFALYDVLIFLCRRSVAIALRRIRR